MEAVSLETVLFRAPQYKGDKELLENVQWKAMKRAYFIKKLKFYNEMAVRIQRVWRGYYVRKYIHNFYALKKYLKAVSLNNELVSGFDVLIHDHYSGSQVVTLFHEYEIEKTVRYHKNHYEVNSFSPAKFLEALKEQAKQFAFSRFTLNQERSELQEYAEVKENEEKMKDLEKKEKRKKHQVRKMHYLLSTEQIPGIYNSPFRKSPDPMEVLLRQSKPLTHRKQQVKIPFADELYGWPTCKEPPAFVTALPLLPADRQKPQGPFRDPAEVLQQRYKPLEPTLRVGESTYSPPAKAKEATIREQWRSTIHDNEHDYIAQSLVDEVYPRHYCVNAFRRFLPFSSYHKNYEKYEPSLWKSGKYGQEAYGTKYFREVYPKKWIADKDFETLFSSIAVFEKFGKTYSSTGQIV
ncbi:hypothetical protein DUI87_09901 [Hirundo rustica rustica]|uniref:Spermatogenesis-associated protein 17 n=1 Tax=Hirundo rustica rustica TaxID=333673 RepID=A0A3M0KGW6_HIRRU|nr:hypothetical protein DUI87_09901 [Hirundo rustica rustica]